MQQAQLDELLQNAELRKFIANHIDIVTSAYALQNHKYDFDIRTALQQIDLLQRIRKKLPEWSAQQPILTRKLIEQCTSENVARYKSTLFKGEKMLDLTAGLGIDAYYMGKNFDMVTVCDADRMNVTILNSNFELLKFGKELETYNIKGEAYLNADSKQFDLIFVDPDRRDEYGNRNLGVSDYSPNVIALLPVLKAKAKLCAIKLSPMLDVTWLENVMHPSVIYCISEKNEMKEILVVIDISSKTKLQRIAVDVLSREKVLSYSGSEKRTVTYDTTAGNDNFFYEAGNAIIKSGLSKQYFESNGMQVLNNNYTFGLAEYLIPDFIGRTFRMTKSGAYNKKNFNKLLGEREITTANITARNFPLTAEELRKTHMLKDGGAITAFFTRDLGGDLKYYLTEQLN
ncbi:MAG: RsmD family RNA methyltransferase [Bacteroidetes bacterium]|nr:RsmD family RNA methyltransferase [Bacteroidota bacterium]